jgi:hypothetical protein
MTRAAGADFTVERLAIPVPALPPEVQIDEAARLFADDPTLRALALVDHGRPVGLLNRQTFVDRYARPFFRERAVNDSTRWRVDAPAAAMAWAPGARARTAAVPCVESHGCHRGEPTSKRTDIALPKGSTP